MSLAGSMMVTYSTIRELAQPKCPATSIGNSFRRLSNP